VVEAQGRHAAHIKEGCAGEHLQAKKYVLANGALRYDTAGVISCAPVLASMLEISSAVGLNSRGVNITTPRRLFDTRFECTSSGAACRCTDERD
jgi:hypothetical protein